MKQGYGPIGLKNNNPSFIFQTVFALTGKPEFSFTSDRRELKRKERSKMWSTGNEKLVFYYYALPKTSYLRHVLARGH